MNITYIYIYGCIYIHLIINTLHEVYFIYIYIYKLLSLHQYNVAVYIYSQTAHTTTLQCTEYEL